VTGLADGQKYFYAHSRRAEVWLGPYDDRESAVEAAQGENPHGTSYIGIGELVSPSGAIGYFDEGLLEWLEENVNEHLTGNCIGGEDPLAHFREDKTEAVNDLRAWAEKHLIVEDWYQVDSEKAEEVKFAGREGAADG
jgi:hypothetical protein